MYYALDCAASLEMSGIWQCIVASGYKTDCAGPGCTSPCVFAIHQSKISFFYFAEHGLVFPYM